MTATRTDIELPDGGCGECELFESAVEVLESKDGPPMALSLTEGNDPYFTGHCTLTGHQRCEDFPACVLKVEAEDEE